MIDVHLAAKNLIVRYKMQTLSLSKFRDPDFYYKAITERQ